MRTTFAYLSLAFFLTGCGQGTTESEPATVDASVYADAIASTARLDGDGDRDASRKPAKVLEFIGARPGDSVLELFAGGGYYTELLAYVVGEDGQVIAHMNQPLVNFAGDTFKARHADDRLPNVEILMAENNELELGADQFDVITIVLNYHDLYWESDQYGWAKFDIPVFLAELYKGLRPGGVLGVIDHYAAPGSPPNTGATLHRIDPAIVINEVTAAGFVLDAQSDALRSAADDLSKNVFDPEVRGKTDRFLLRFRKPE